MNRKRKRVNNNNYLMFYFIFIFILKIGQVLSAEKNNWHFYGPGLDGTATVPGRYFYGIILDRKGNQLDARKLSKDDIKFELIAPASGKTIHSDREFGFKHDGSIIFRYRLRFSIPGGALLRITHKNDVILERKFALNKLF